MKNKHSMLMVLPILLFIGLGCGTVTDMASSQTEAPIANTVSNAVNNPENLMREKTGVAECDQLIDFIADQSKSQDEGYIARAAKEFFFNQIRQKIKENVEQNKSNPQEMAKNCKDFKKQIDAFAAEENVANK